MQTSTPSLRQIAVPVAFGLLCLVVAIAVWRSFGGTVPMEANGYRVVVAMQQADGLFSETDVRIAGVRVGKVQRVERRGTGADVTMEIEAPFAPIRTGATLVPRTKTLLGEAYVELAPGSRSAPALPDGGRLAASRVRTAQRLDDVLQTFDPRTRSQMRQLVRGVARGFDGREVALNQALGRAAPATTDFGVLIDVLHRQRPELQSAISGSAKTFAALGRRDAALGDAIDATGQVLTVTADRNRDLQRLLAMLPGALEDLRSASRSVASAAPDLNRAVRSLEPTAALLEPALRSLVADTPVVRRVFAALPAVLTAADRGLPDLGATLDAAGPQLEAPYQASRELIPFVKLLAVSRNSIVGAIANVASMTNGQTTYPGGHRRSYVSAGLTAWNEIIGGWTKKLPTNRQNPYPAPDSAAKIGTGGLEAYDCRNVLNPMLVPAIGSGVPDCKQQQPWEFDGRVAAYPRLLLAAP